MNGVRRAARDDSPAPSRATLALWAARRLLTAAPAIGGAALAAVPRPSVPRPARGPLDGAARRRRDAAAFRRLALRMGGLAIKVGQALAARADLLAPEHVAVLATLEDRVPPRPFASIRARIERELGRPLPEVYAHLEEAPMAAASLAQVHRGRLHDGREVAVKVLYPGIEEAVRRDLGLLRWLLAPLLVQGAGIHLEEMLDELARTVPAELDLVHEGHNAERVGATLRHRPDIAVPAIVWPATAPGVLTMEFVDGIKVTDRDGLAAAGIDPRAVAELLTDVYCEQILERGVFHADPHPGNLLVLPGPRLALLDFGLVKVLPDGFRRALGRLVQAIALDDEPTTLASLRELGFRTAGAHPGPLLALRDLFLGSLAPGRGYADPAALAQADRRLREALAATPLLAVPGDLTLVARVMGALSGIGKQLDSRVNVPLALLVHS